MSEVLASVDSRTQLAGRNRMELLLFSFGSGQKYGINVFKVREVIRCPSLSPVPDSDPSIKGIADIRGSTITIIDLAQAIGLPGVAEDGLDSAFVIITEYNDNIQGFLVNGVDRIVNLSWENIQSPPSGTTAQKNYLTAVTHVDDQLVEIIDVEQVFANVIGVNTEISETTAKHASSTDVSEAMVLVADDSFVARNQVKRTLEKVGIKAVLTHDGQECLATRQKWKRNNPELIDNLTMLIADIEMPNMDGYTLTSAIRKDPALKKLFIVLHSSLSGVFNANMVEKVGADLFMSKYHPDELAELVLDRIRDIQAGNA